MRPGPAGGRRFPLRRSYRFPLSFRPSTCSLRSRSVISPGSRRSGKEASRSVPVRLVVNQVKEVPVDPLSFRVKPPVRSGPEVS